MKTHSALIVSVVLLSALAGCSSDDTSAPSPAPGASPGHAEAPSSSGTPDPGEGTPSPTSAVVDFPNSGGISTLGCDNRLTDYVIYFQLSADSDIELTSLTTDTSGGAEVGRAWVSDTKAQLTSSGILAVDAGGNQISDEAGWADKHRLRGYELEAGRTYTYFAELSLDLMPGATVDGLDLTYRHDGTAGTATAPVSITRKSDCR